MKGIINEHEILFKTIVLSPSNTCSGGCIYCYARDRLKKDKTRIDHNFIEKVFKYIADSPFADKNCSITLGGGGDPFENFDVYLELLSFAEEFYWQTQIKVPIFVSTCDPRFITPEKISHLVESQSALGISIDGPPGAAYLSRRILPSCLNSLRDLKRISLCASGVFTKASCAYIKEIYEFYLSGIFENFQLRPVRLAPANPLNLKKNDLQKVYEIYESFIEDLIQMNLIEPFLKKTTTADFFSGFIYKYLLKAYKSTRCGAGIKLAFLDLSGNLYLCPSLAFPEIRIGHIEDPSKISQNIIKKAHTKKEICVSCPIYNVCGGPCSSESYLKYNSIGEIDPDMCQFQINMASLAQRTLYRLNRKLIGIPRALIENYRKHKVLLVRGYCS